MRLPSLVLVALLLCPVLPLQARELIAQGRGTLAIDAAGRVESVQFATSHGAAVDKVLSDRIHAWRFEPVLEQGRAVPVSAHMQYLLHATIGEQAEELRLSIHDVDFVDPPAATPTAPSPYRKVTPVTYPRQMIAERFGAQLELAVEQDAEGTPVHVAPATGWLLGRTVAEKVRDRKMGYFVRAAVGAVKQWRFAPPQAGATRVTVPITFTVNVDSVDQAAQLARWTEAMPVAFPKEAWMVDLGEDVFLALDAEGRPQRRDLKLLTDPRG